MTLRLSYDGITNTRTFTTAEVHRFYFPEVPPDTIVTDLALRCTGSAGSLATLDWITAQNGQYEWAPMMDVSIAFDDTGFPTGGRQTVARLSEGYSPDGGGLLFVGSDVGGMAWTPPHDPENEPTPGTPRTAAGTTGTTAPSWA